MLENWRIKIGRGKCFGLELGFAGASSCMKPPCVDHYFYSLFELFFSFNHYSLQFEAASVATFLSTPLT